jgi:hypothetical protein
LDSFEPTIRFASLLGYLAIGKNIHLKLIGNQKREFLVKKLIDLSQDQVSSSIKPDPNHTVFILLLFGIICKHLQGKYGFECVFGFDFKECNIVEYFKVFPT